jgi:hypothetical protein
VARELVYVVAFVVYDRVVRRPTVS